MIRRRAARELLLKILFQVDVGRLPLGDVIATAWEEIHPPEDERRYVEEIAAGVTAELPRLDALIGSLAEGWDVSRLARVDRCLLRAALYELIHRPSAPVAEVVNDAVEIAKRFSTEASGKFVNGILGGFLRRKDELLREHAPAAAGTHT